MLSHSPPSWRGSSLNYTLNRLGLQTGIRQVLDAGDAASCAGGSSQPITDLSPQLNPWTRGATTGATTDDPAFNGTAGNLSNAEFFSFDGGDVITVQTSQPSWIRDMADDSGIGTILVWAQFPASGVLNSIAGSHGSGTTNRGFVWQVEANDNILWRIRRTTNVLDDTRPTTMTFTTPAVPTLFGIAIDEANSSFRFHLNGVSEDVSHAYTSPPTAGTSATNLQQSMGVGGNITLAPSGSRWFCLMGWIRQLSASEMAAVYNATRGRFLV